MNNEDIVRYSCFFWWITDDQRLSNHAREIISNGDNELGKSHDIDIAIFLDSSLYRPLDKKSLYGYEAELIAEIIHLLKYDLVDLVVLNKATPVLAYEVIRNGILFFSRSEDVRIQFEIASLKRHADTKHLRNIKRMYSEIRTEKGLSAYGSLGSH